MAAPASLEVAPVRLVTAGLCPWHTRRKPRRGPRFSTCFRAEKELNWTFVSPSALFAAGERTGKFRLGTDQLLTAADGKSSISFEDSQLHSPTRSNAAHIRKRFTVGY